MNTDHDNPVPPDQEARITALLLGELTSAESAALSAELQANPELALLHERLRQTLALVSEVVTASPAPNSAGEPTPRFSESRRDVLLRVLKSPPAPFRKTKSRSRFVWAPWLRMAALLALLGIAAFLSLPNFVKARYSVQHSSTATDLALGRSADFSGALPEPPRAGMATGAATDLPAISAAPPQAPGNEANPRPRPARAYALAEGDRSGGVYLPVSPGAKPPVERTPAQVPADAGFGEAKLAFQRSETPGETRGNLQALEGASPRFRIDALEDDLSAAKDNLRRGARVDPQPVPATKAFKELADLTDSIPTPPRPASAAGSSTPSPALAARYGLAPRSATGALPESQSQRESRAASQQPFPPPQLAEELSDRKLFEMDVATMRRAPAPSRPAISTDAAGAAAASPRSNPVAAEARDQSTLALGLPGEAGRRSLERELLLRENEARPSAMARTAAEPSVGDKSPGMDGFTGRPPGEAARPSIVFFGKEPAGKLEAASPAPAVPSVAMETSFGASLFLENNAASPEAASAARALTSESFVTGIQPSGLQGGSQTGRQQAGGKFDARTSDELSLSEKPADSMAAITLSEKKSSPSQGLAKRHEVHPPDLESKSKQAGGAPVGEPAPVPQPEQITQENAISTFSLNISDVSFKLAAASLASGMLPSPGTIRSEEFINAFDYRDPQPSPGSPIGFVWDRARYAFGHNQDLLRFSLKTAASGREPGRPCNLVILLDNSGSMERSDRVGIIREILTVLGSKLGPQDRVSVVAFARTSRLWVDGMLGSQSADVLRKVGELIPEGGTNLEEALRLGYETALRHFMSHGMNRVIVLTDGAANLGETNPEALQSLVEAHRKRGVALDCFGIGWEGYNDLLLERLSRNGDGRYGFVNSAEEASTSFVNQLAGALNLAAADVKVQVEFNPLRVPAWRQIGYAAHQLKKEQFRDNTVDAAEIAAAEAGNALYVVKTDPQGQGPIGVVRARYREPSTGIYRELEWSVPYAGGAGAIELASSAMRLAGTSALFAEWLASSPYAAAVTLDALQSWIRGVPDSFAPDPRPRQLETMLRQARSISGQ